MDFELSPSQVDMRDSARRMVERELTPMATRHRGRLPKESFLEVLRVLARQRLTAARLPEADGGPGMSMLDYGIVFEQLPPHIGMGLLSHEGCVASLYLEGSAAHKDRCCGTSSRDAG